MRKIKRATISKNASLDEPIWDGTLESLPKVLNWYSYEKDQDDAKQYILAYAKHIDLPKSDIKLLLTTKERVNTSIAWLSKISLNYSSVSESDFIKSKIVSEIDRLLEIEKTKTATTPVVVNTRQTANVQENIKAKLAEHVGQINYEVDAILLKIRCNQEVNFSLKNWLRENAVGALQAKAIASYFRVHVIPELLEAKSGTCEQLNEAYSFLTSKQLNVYIQVIEQFIADCDEQYAIKKQIAIHNRTPRKVKKNPLKQVAKLKYLKEHETLKSIVPTQIIGAKAVLLYNPETRVVSYYACDNNHGLGIKGTTLVNYDAAQSVAKILRKPNETLTKLLSDGRVSVRRCIQELSSKGRPISGRINESLLILRAFS